MAYEATNGWIGALAARWWVLLVRGLAAIVFGVLALVMPGPSLLALVFVWGAYAIVDGVLELALAARRGRAGARWGWYVFEGLVGIVAGVVTFAWPGITALVLLVMIGVWAILTGIAEIVAAVELRGAIRGEWMLGASGVCSLVFGILLFLFPGAGALTVVWLIGAYAIVFGALLCGLAFRVRQLRAGGERRAPTGGTPSLA